LNLLIKVKNRL